ncbi:MAG: hypothetical protein ACRD0O_14295 [Acidimicrobiia bacterium]
MGDRHLNDDHAADLTHVREVHDVVDNLRRLLAAAAEADQAAIQAEAFEELAPAPRTRPSAQFPPLQSPPGR